MDLIDATLARAGQLREATAEQRDALDALATSRTPRATRRRRVLIPTMSISAALVVLGAGAAVATQWAPWNYVPDEDIVIARDWVDVNGNALGSCESRLAAGALPADALASARSYLDSLDTDSLEPDGETIAGLLVAVDQPQRMGQLVQGRDVGDYDINHTGPSWDRAWWSDARILQDGLVKVVFTGMSDHLTLKWPELNTTESSIEARVQTQCTTDPAPAGEG